MVYTWDKASCFHCVFCIIYSVYPVSTEQINHYEFFNELFIGFYSETHICHNRFSFPVCFIVFRYAEVYIREWRREKNDGSHMNFDVSISKSILSMRCATQSYLNCHMATDIGSPQNGLFHSSQEGREKSGCGKFKRMASGFMKHLIK